jgi:hypothetical protein
MFYEELESCRTQDDVWFKVDVEECLCHQFSKSEMQVATITQTFINRSSRTASPDGTAKLRTRNSDRVERGYAEWRYEGDWGEDKHKTKMKGRLRM